MSSGVCGGVWAGDNRFSAGGSFATNEITGTYTEGQVIDVTVRVALISCSCCNQCGSVTDAKRLIP